MSRGGWVFVSSIIAAVTGVVLLTRKKPKLRRPPCDDMGDIDGDGYVTHKDSQLVADYIVGKIVLTPEQFYRADVNGDGMVSGFDGMIIEQYIEGLIDTFPACQIPIRPAIITDIKFLDESMRGWEWVSSPPSNVPALLAIGVNVAVVNQMESPLNLRVFFQIISPTGSRIGPLASLPQQLEPGQTGEFQQLHIANYRGDWYMRVELYLDPRYGSTPPIDTWEGKIATVI